MATRPQTGTANEPIVLPERPPAVGRGDALALAAWTAAVTAVFFDAVTLRKAFFYFDITEINYPYRHFLASEWRAGRFSRWMPGLYCGLPLYSESQAGYLHPLKFLLYPWLATWQAFNLDTVLSVWLTGIGAYAWLRRHVGPAGALTGAVVFGLGGFTWSHLVHTSMTNALLSVPFCLLAVERVWDGAKPRGLVWGALALACQVFAGHLQDAILTAWVIGLYALYRAAIEPTRGRRAFVVLTAGAMLGLGVLLAAVQWVPSKELIDRSPRSAGLKWDDLTFGSWHPELLPTWLVREAYGTRARDTDWMDGFYPWQEMDTFLGVVALGLAVVGMRAHRDRWVAFWPMLLGAAVLMMLGRYTFLCDYLPYVPIVGSGRIPVRFHLWMTIAVAALASVGVDRLSRPGGVSLRRAVVAIGILALACVPILAYAYYPAFTDMARWNLPYHKARYRWLAEQLVGSTARTALLATAAWLAASLAVRSADLRRRRIFAATLPVLVAVELLAAHWYDAPTIDPRYWTVPPATARRLAADPSVIRVSGTGVLSAGEPGYASEPGRVDFMAARDTLAWSLPPVWGLRSSSGITPIVSRRYFSYADHVQFGAGRFDVEGVSHMLTGPSAAIVGWEKPVRVGSTRIHRNPRVLPRVRLMGRPVYVGDEAAAVAALGALKGEIRERIIVEDPDRPLGVDARASGSARIVSEIPERVEVATNSTSDAYLFLADTYDPGWTATVDGRPAPIRPATVMFRAVFVSKGRHRVVFAYRPAGFDRGLAVTGVGLAATLGLLLLGRRDATPGPRHGPAPLPASWPRWGAGVFVAIIALSAVGLDASGRPTIHSRWDRSWHRFTWGAGIEAMKPAARADQQSGAPGG